MLTLKLSRKDLRDLFQLVAKDIYRIEAQITAARTSADALERLGDKQGAIRQEECAEGWERLHEARIELYETLGDLLK